MNEQLNSLFDFRDTLTVTGILTHVSQLWVLLGGDESQWLEQLIVVPKVATTVCQQKTQRNSRLSGGPRTTYNILFGPAPYTKQSNGRRAQFDGAMFARPPLFLLFWAVPVQLTKVRIPTIKFPHI